MNRLSTFLKPGYAPNDSAQTYDGLNAETYWTPQRISESRSFQYDVYRLAARLARKHGFRNCLDVGCGSAMKTKQFLASVVQSVYLVDQPSCRSLVEATFPEATFLPADLEHCDFRLAECFDLIICADVLEHLHDPWPCMSWIKRHLCPEGLAIFSSPERDILRGTECMHSPHPAHVCEWNQAEFRSMLEAAGFVVHRQALFPVSRLSPMTRTLRCLLPPQCQPKHWKACQVAVCSK